MVEYERLRDPARRLFRIGRQPRQLRRFANGFAGPWFRCFREPRRTGRVDLLFRRTGARYGPPETAHRPRRPRRTVTPRERDPLGTNRHCEFRTGLRPVPLDETTKSRVMPANAGIQNATSLSGFALFIGSATLSRLGPLLFMTNTGNGCRWSHPPRLLAREEPVARRQGLTGRSESAIVS